MPVSLPLKRILLVSHNFPPTLGPESSLVRLNTIDLISRGWKVSVLTTTMEHVHQTMDPGMLKGLPEDLEIMRTTSYDATLRRLGWLVGTILLMLLRRWPLPEVFFLWLFSSVPAGRGWLKRSGPAVIYSRATKHVSNVAGWALKRSSGLPWVAHFSDPWQGDHLNPVQAWVARWLERRIFRDADAIVTVNERLRSVFAATHPGAADKIHMIPHGYAPLEQIPPPSAGVGGRPLQAIHAGSFMPNLREPDQLFKGLAHLNKRLPLKGLLHLTCVGEETIRYQSMADGFGLRDVVSLCSSIPYQQCQDMVAASDLLVVIDALNKGGIHLPTKLIEYLPYEKPVLGLTENGSAVHQVLQHCDLAFGDQNSVEEIATAFERLIKQWQSGTWGVSALNRERVADYRIDRVNAKLHDLLTQLSGTFPA